MGVCFSKKGGEPSSPNELPSKDLSEEKNAMKEEKKKSEVTDRKAPLVLAVAAPSLGTKKASCSGEEKGKKNAEAAGKKGSQPVDERGCKISAPMAIPGEQLPEPLRASSCTKEEVDAILIQCGRLSRNSSGKTSKDTGGSGGHRRYSGSKRSYDFDSEWRGEEEELDKAVSRPSPRRQTPNRERSGSRERRVSRSPGKRSDGPVFTTSVSDHQKQQPTKMVSVPAREKGALFVDGDTGNKNLGAKRVPASPRSRSPANNTRISNENLQPQSLSRNSSRKGDQSPYRRNPLSEMEENALRDRSGSSTNISLKSRDVNEVMKKSICNSDQRSNSHPNPSSKKQHKAKQDIMEEVNQMIDAKVASIGQESLNPTTLTRTRSSRRSSRDLDNNPGFNPIASYASLLFEDNQNEQQQQLKAFSLPACISKACSILDAVADLNSSCSDRRSYEAEQSNNSRNKNEEFMVRGLLSRRDPFIGPMLEVKDDLLEPSLHKFVTVRKNGKDMDPQESAGSNSFVGQPWASSLWEMNSVDSTCGTALIGNGKEVEDEVGDAGNQQQQRSWQRPGPASSAGNPMKNKREFDLRQV